MDIKWMIDGYFCKAALAKLRETGQTTQARTFNPELVTEKKLIYI
jgi:hypothetical protein